jgi:hypothetical protein
MTGKLHGRTHARVLVQPARVIARIVGAQDLAEEDDQHATHTEGDHHQRA